MKIILHSLKFKKGNPYIHENDVHVHFEYEIEDDLNVKFYFDVYVGKDELDYRFQLQLNYRVSFDSQFDETDVDFIGKIIDRILPSLTELITLLDGFVREERH